MNAPVRIVFDADPFCFGPISTTLNIVDQLRTRGRLPDGVRLVLLGTLTSRQLGEKSALLDDVFECNTTSRDALLAHAELIAGAALYVTNTNPASIAIAAELGTPVIYVDTLFWMWNEVAPEVRLADHVFVQVFHGIERNLARLHAPDDRLTVVPPIISAHARKATSLSDEVLITLGGIDTVYAQSTDFWFTFLEEVLSLEALADHPNIVIAGGGHTIGRLKTFLSAHFPHVTVDCFDKPAFLTHLACARKVLASPGLTTFYECQALDKDVFFLPPQNYSQQLQLDTYLSHYYTPEHGLLWEASAGYPVISPHLPELEGIRRIEACTQRFIASPDERKRALAKVAAFLASGDTHMPSRMDTQAVGSITAIAEYIEHQANTAASHTLS